MAHRPRPLGAAPPIKRGHESRTPRLISLAQLPKKQREHVKANLARFWVYVAQVREFEMQEEQELL